jgi:hypothetical protein
MHSSLLAVEFELPVTPWCHCAAAQLHALRHADTSTALQSLLPTAKVVEHGALGTPIQAAAVRLPIDAHSAGCALRLPPSNTLAAALRGVVPTCSAAVPTMVDFDATTAPVAQRGAAYGGDSDDDDERVRVAHAAPFELALTRQLVMLAAQKEASVSASYIVECEAAGMWLPLSASCDEVATPGGGASTASFLLPPQEASTLAEIEESLPLTARVIFIAARYDVGNQHHQQAFLRQQAVGGHALTLQQLDEEAEADRVSCGITGAHHGAHRFTAYQEFELASDGAWGGELEKRTQVDVRPEGPRFTLPAEAFDAAWLSAMRCVDEAAAAAAAAMPEDAAAAVVLQGAPMNRDAASAAFAEALLEVSDWLRGKACTISEAAVNADAPGDCDATVVPQGRPRPAPFAARAPKRHRHEGQVKKRHAAQPPPEMSTKATRRAQRRLQRAEATDPREMGANELQCVTTALLAKRYASLEA